MNAARSRMAALGGANATAKVNSGENSVTFERQRQQTLICADQ